MSLWSRLRHGVTSLIDRLSGGEPPEVSDREDREAPRREAETRDHESRLPPGWVLAGLYHEGERHPRKIHATDDTEVTDSEIQEADGLVVWFGDAGGDGYFWIHGATGWDSIADQINRTIKVVSL